MFERLTCHLISDLFRFHPHYHRVEYLIS